MHFPSAVLTNLDIGEDGDVESTGSHDPVSCRVLPIRAINLIPSGLLSKNRIGEIS